MALGFLAILLGGATGGGCGASLNAEAGFTPAALANGLRWIGVDPRPLAVGTQATISFEVPAGVACCSAGYQVQSSDFTVLTVTDLGNQALSIQAVGAGAAEVQVISGNTLVGSQPFTVAVATSIVFGDPSQLAAGIEDFTDLPPVPAKFALLQNGYGEDIQAVISDASGTALASENLATGTPGTGIIVHLGKDPESFILDPAVSATSGTFFGGLAGQPSTILTYDIDIVSAAASASLRTRKDSDGNTIVLAVALDTAGDEVFGLPAWTFTITGPGTLVHLGDAAQKAIFPTATTPGSATVTATNGSLTASKPLP